MEYHIAEIFSSVQGEGGNSGRPMVFIRLAGCNVGKPYSRAEREYHPELKIFQNECTIYDGRKFPCDTNYRLNRKLTEEEIVAEARRLNPLCNWVSITGGEPLMHDLKSLLDCLEGNKFNMHLETSGTIPLTSKTDDLLAYFDWVVVSPKYPYIDDYCKRADEIRILIDKDFKWEKLPESVKKRKDILWISPVNDAGTLRKENADVCLGLLAKYPGLRLSMQIHKILGVR